MNASSHRRLRRLAVWAAGWAASLLPDGRQEWGRAVAREVECIEDDAEA